MATHDPGCDGLVLNQHSEAGLVSSWYIYAKVQVLLAQSVTTMALGRVSVGQSYIVPPQAFWRLARFCVTDGENAVCCATSPVRRRIWNHR